MPKKYAPLCVFLLLIVSINPCIVEAQEQIDDALAKSLQQALDVEFEAQNSTGITAAVSMPDGGMWLGTSGLADPSKGEIFRTDHRIGFASITKNVCSCPGSATC